MEPHSDFKPWYYWPFSKRTTVLALSALGLFFLVFQVNKMLTSSFRIELFGVEILEVEHLDTAAEEAPPEIEPVIRERVVVKRVPLPPAPPLLPMPPEEEPREVFVVVEQMPELIGGLASIQQQIRYPEMAKRAGVEGRVILQFIVNERGRVEEVQVVRGVGAGCDEEAVRVVKQARFKPGKQRGAVVKVKMSIPVTFKLQ